MANDSDFKDINNLPKKQAKKEIESLRKKIEHHDYLYYVKNKPEISDYKYDKMFKRLQNLENAFPEFQTENSPTKRIGGEPVDKLRKKEHAGIMLSLDAGLEEKEIKNFFDFIYRETGKDKLDFFVEPKFDGLSVEIVYKNGIFYYGATRGNGEEGDDISKNLKTIKSLPLKLLKDEKIPSFLSVRGEVYLPKDGFQKVNKERIKNGKEPFANPRNAAAGTVRQLDPKKVAKIPLKIVFYDILKVEDFDFKEHKDTLEQLPKWGLRTDNSHSKLCSSFEQVNEHYENIKGERENLNYEIDGIVIKLNDYNLRKELGTRQRSPRWAIAWKFPPKKEITKLEDIVVQVGRTGKLTPIGLLDPVNIGGVTVSRATLHNEDEVLRKDLRPKDKVKVSRAGDVIPEIVERVDDRKEEQRTSKFKMPDNCPVCGADVIKEGAYHFCPAGLSCKRQLVGRIMHFASRQAMNIDFLGEETVNKLVEKDFLKDMSDLFKLSKKNIKSLEGFADKSSENLYNAIQNSKRTTLSRFLFALGIRHVGEHVAQLISQEFKDLEKIKEASEEDLLKIKEIGPEIAKSIVNFFKEKQNIEVIKKMFKRGITIKTPEEKPDEQILKDLRIVFTGELEDYTREKAKDIVESLGARVTSSMSSNTDYLVTGKNPGSKLEKAKKENVKIIDEQEFKKLLKS